MFTVTRITERNWRSWREIRLAALADAPDAFSGTLAEAEALPDDDWREMTRAGAIFIAAEGGTRGGGAGAGDAPADAADAPAGALAGVVAGLARESAAERGLGAMWVAPAWRGRGAAGALIAAVVGWARAEGAERLGLWVPADNARARACYQRQGFEATGRSYPFPGSTGRFIDEMHLDLARPATAPGP